MFKIMIIASLFASALLFQLNAGCTCECVDGQVQALCESSIDLKPICPPKICPQTPPAVKPIDAPVVPPVGTTHCTNKFVYNNETHQYEWMEVCQ